MIRPSLAIAINFPLLGVRLIVIIASLGIWFLTQSLLGKRAPMQSENGGVIFDGVHRMTARQHRWLSAVPRRADILLILSSLVIDLLGIFLLGSAILGHTFQPFIGLFLLFALRQICQAFCPLPPPDGMIWRDPGFPALLVTYGTTNDLFFSGHTAIAVFGALYLANTLGPLGIALGIAIAIFEIGAVLILRAHYTMDVFTGIVTAFWVYDLAVRYSPMIDQLIAQLLRAT